MANETATATALGQAAGTASRHSAQNVHYKMKFNSSTGKWEQEEVMTPLVKTVYPGIRTKEGTTKDISTGLVSQPVDEGSITQPGFPSPEPEPEVTPTPTPTPTPTVGLGGYEGVKEQYQKPTGITQVGGVKYEPEQVASFSPALQNNMKFNVMPGGLNFRSGAQNFSLSQSHGLINHLVNPQVESETEKKEAKFKLPGLLGAAATIAGTTLQPRSERFQITKMIEAGALQVRDAEGNVLNNADVIKFLTEDKDGRLKIRKGKDLIDSKYTVTQTKNLSKDYANSPAFMNFQEDKDNNMNTPSGVKLTTLNPVMGSAGTTFFGILKAPIGASSTNGEQVLVVGASNGGAYRSDGKFVGMNGQIYSRGTAGQAQESANAGHIPEEVLKRMTNEDGTLKNLYLEGGEYAIDSNMIVNGRYIGNVVAENGDVINSDGNSIANVADPDGSDGRYDDFIEERWEKPETPTREEVEESVREKYDTSGRGGTGQSERQQFVERQEKQEKKEDKKETKRCFHPEQLIGNKFIKDLQPGDLINGIEIIGMVKLKLNEPMYSLNDVRVTGTHKVKYNNNWIYVYNHPDSFKINDKPEFVYVPIVKGGIFNINNNEFADYDDEHIETLDNKLKVA